MKKTAAEIHALAVDLMQVGQFQQADRLFKASEEMRLVKAEDEVTPYKEMETWLDGNLTRFPKDKQGAWWDPPHNYCINSALMGLNTWQFHILPRMRVPLHYPSGVPAADGAKPEPDGIIIDPSWWPTTSGDPTKGDTVDHSVKVAEILAKFAKGQQTVQQTVKNELTWLEGKYGVKIPPAIEATLIKDALKVATRRWGVNRLRSKKILVPFDGSKAQEMSNW